MFSKSIGVPSYIGCNRPYKSLLKSKNFRFLKLFKFDSSILLISDRLSILNFSIQKFFRSPFTD